MIKLKVLKSEPSSMLGNVMRDTTVGKSYDCTQLLQGEVDPYGCTANCDALLFKDDTDSYCVVYATPCELYEVTND